MKNLQISIDDMMLSYLDRVAELQQKTRTALIREAIAYWIRQKNIEQFENQWIGALKNNKTAYPEEEEAWLAAEAWDER
jgi:metal-responsive CopG/Arc/MetJ family transcriptional regulator